MISKIIYKSVWLVSSVYFMILCSEACIHKNCCNNYKINDQHHHRSPKQFYVPFPYTLAEKNTVMVVSIYANSTVGAMVCVPLSFDLTHSAVVIRLTHSIFLPSLHKNFSSFFFVFVTFPISIVPLT